MSPKLVISVAATVIILVGLFVLSGRGRHATSSQAASVTFLGFTNIPGSGRHAMLAISNTSSVRTAFLVDSFEESVGGVWKTRPLTDAAGLTAQGLKWLGGFRGWEQFLEPGRGFAACVPLPTTNAAWRIRFICQERARGDDWRSLWGTATPRSIVLLVNANRKLSRYQVFSGSRYSIVSPEVSQ